MNRISIIIPSKNAANLERCIAAIEERDPHLHRIIIDDGLDMSRLLGDEGQFIIGDKPFVYARNCNAGIRAAGDDDLILLNDDALLETTGGFTALQSQWASHPEFGLVAAGIDSCGTPEQIWRPGNRLREMFVMAVFACVFIPRSTIDRVGLLDERFSAGADGNGPRGYGCEDDDYSWRVRAAGLKLAVYDGCKVNHTKLPSTFRTPDYDHMAGVRIHERVFLDKWGHHPRSPINFRTGKRINWNLSK